ncbi:SdpI family protein [Actinoplanes sp. CA-030573]|uniref:SdpI family protein n=1 Tax=Actinoplanes sp. CA-030573 TaxID=3239898 RepID=UPI003D8C5447
MVAAVVVIGAGALVALTGVLGLLGRLPRNRVAGVRTSATLRSDRAFEIGNRVAAPLVIAGGAAAVAGGLVALALPDRARTACVLAGVVLLVALVVAGGVRGDRAARKATSE